MPSFSLRFTVLPALLAAGAVLVGSSPIRGQSLVDPVVGTGELRIRGGGVFLGWSDEFGIDGERVSAGAGLTRASAAELIPGLDDLRSALESLVGTSGPFRLGASTAAVSHNEVRVPLSLDVGVWDRLTVGITVPLVRTTLEADVRIAADEGADLGINPRVESAAAVESFFADLDGRIAAAAALRTQLCGEDPGSDGCAAATSLASDLGDARLALDQAYFASGLFPAGGTTSGDALAAYFDGLDAALTAQGLAPLTSGPPLATAVLDREGLATLVSAAGGPFRAAPLGSYANRWGLGDVEARVAARLLQGERLDSAGVPTLAWSLAAMGTVRLPTGTVDSTAVFLDRGWDDGQMDLEGGAWFSVATRRLALRAQVVYTLQQAAEVERRIAPYGQVLSGAGDVAPVDWDPGDGLQVEVEPAFRLAPALSLAASWRFTSRGADSYAYPAGTVFPDQQPPVRRRYYPDATLLDEGTEVSLHEVGGTLTYRSRGLPETEGGGFEAYLRVHRAVSGSGGRVPAGVRSEFGLRLVRRLWGG